MGTYSIGTLIAYAEAVDQGWIDPNQWVNVDQELD